MLYSAVIDRYYVGQTSNLEDRLKRHNHGRSKYTKSGIPWKLVYKESFETRSEAMKKGKEVEAFKKPRAFSSGNPYRQKQTEK